MRGGPPRAWVLCDSGGGRPHRCSWRGSQDQGRGPRASPLHALLWTRPPIHVHRSWAPRPCSPWVHLPDPMSGWCSGECGACPVPLASPRDHGLRDVQPRSCWGAPCGQEMTRRGCGAAPFWTTVCCMVHPTSATCSGHFVCFQVSDNP